MMVAVLLVFGVSGQGANAAEGNDAETGYITIQPRGVYLQSGFSKIINLVMEKLRLAEILQHKK